ncbi:hypothetical protein B1218_35150, partial [Pseudomonas ogarae]
YEWYNKGVTRLLSDSPKEKRVRNRGPAPSGPRPVADSRALSTATASGAGPGRSAWNVPTRRRAGRRRGGCAEAGSTRRCSQRASQCMQWSTKAAAERAGTGGRDRAATGLGTAGNREKDTRTTGKSARHLGG